MDLGLYLEFPRRAGESEAQAFEESMIQARMAEELGLDSVWLAELHFAPRRSVLASPLLVAGYIAGVTQRVHVGTAVEVLPLGNPIRLAEEVATLDHICQGRFEFGIGRSGAATAYQAYNVPYEESKARFFETLNIMTSAWTQERFSFEGAFFQYHDVCVVPKPLQHPYPPLRIAVNSPDTFPTAAQMQLPIFIGLRARPELLQQRVESYLQAWEEAGNPGEPDVCLRLPIYVAETMEKALAEPQESAMSFSKSRLEQAVNLPVPGLSDAENQERIERGKRVKNMTYDDLLQSDVAFGTPEVVTEKVLALQQKFHFDSVIAEVNIGSKIPRDRVENSIRLFAEQVAPQLR